MKYQAVIFDLFGTLVDSFTIKAHEDSVREIAEALAVSADDLNYIWHGIFSFGALDSYQTTEENMRHICRELGVAADEEKIKLASQLRSDFIMQTLKPRREAVDVISRLRKEGLKIGLISDSSVEVPLSWGETPFAPLFDVTVFSCAVGLQKPDARIYQLAMEMLEVKPEACLYVGDGGSQETKRAKESLYLGTFAGPSGTRGRDTAPTGER